MILYIDTTDKKQVKVALKKDNKVIAKMSEENRYGSQVLLPLIDKLLTKNNVKYDDLTGVEVETGPGSFTGIRVGVSVTNALGFCLGILVNDKKIKTDLTY